MARRYGNAWSRVAGGLTVIAHSRAPVIRWIVLVVLGVVWLWAGFVGWRATEQVDESEAIYRTFGALTVADSYRDVSSEALQIARFAGLAVPLVGILFAFWGQLGRSLAQVCHRFASNHVVIAGGGQQALSLATNCVRAGDSVMVIAAGVPEETAWAMRVRGVTLIQARAGDRNVLKAARADHAAHVVAFDDDDTENLQTEAALQRLVGEKRPRTPINAHVSTRSPMLLREAREMRAREMKRRPKGVRPAIDPKPFSLDEIAARALIQDHAPTLLALADELGQQRLHVVFFGFDAVAEAVAARALMSLWSMNMDAPRMTVLVRDPALAERRFHSHYPEAFAHPELWQADVTFVAFDWSQQTINLKLLSDVQADRGQPTALVVATGEDAMNIQLALSLKRTCNQGHIWPAPIFMRETMRTEFSELYARGDDTPERDAYLLAFGAHQDLASREYILDGVLDRGAAIAHEHYMKNLAKKDMSLRELQASMGDWRDVLETYRDANRAVADSAIVKVWDAGWRPARDGEKGETAPTIDDDMMQSLSKVEHSRWMAERLLSGWRPGQERNNEHLVHDDLRSWDDMHPDGHGIDTTQVRASLDVARMLYPKGFVRRETGSVSRKSDAA